MNLLSYFSMVFGLSPTDEENLSSVFFPTLLMILAELKFFVFLSFGENLAQFHEKLAKTCVFYAFSMRFLRVFSENFTFFPKISQFRRNFSVSVKICSVSQNCPQFC